MTATPTTAEDTYAAAGPGTDTDVLREVSRRVLWLSAAIVDAANRGQPNTQRCQGRRTPGFVRVDGRHHGRAVVPQPAW